MKYFDDLTIVLAGGLEQNQYSMNTHPTYCGIQFVLSGKVRLQIDHGKVYHLTGPVAFLTHPDHFYYYTNEQGSPPRHHLWCCFYGERVRRFTEGGLFPVHELPRITVPADAEAFEFKFRKLIHLANTPYAHDYAVLLLENILLEMSNPRPRPHEDVPFREYFRNLYSNITNTPCKEWDFQAEAADLCISLNYFNRLFRQFCHTSPRKAVLDARLHDAAELLLNTHCTIAETARHAGFNNAFYFSRLFKTRYHMSPEHYRKEFAGEEHPAPNVHDFA
ncbi:MAG: AraC family transcriptional regulator [Lentisphaeria bacterium]|nr:AraC family transcriptional regulator [Lentisphaeria bacterium]